MLHRLERCYKLFVRASTRHYQRGLSSKVCMCVFVGVRDRHTHSQRLSPINNRGFSKMLHRRLNQMFQPCKKKRDSTSVPFSLYLMGECGRSERKKNKFPGVQTSICRQSTSRGKFSCVAEARDWESGIVVSLRGLRLWLAAEVQRSRNSGSNEIKLKSKLKKEKKRE